MNNELLIKLTKKTLVISAINFFEGGPLSVLKDCLDCINKSEYPKEFRIIALVHKKELIDTNYFSKVDFIEFPKSRSSYLYRLYYELFYFKTFAKENDVHFWLSLHDITPSLDGVIQFVYCHNPSPFNKINLGEIITQPIQVFFNLFYKYLYRINIYKNDYIIVQQLWIKQNFIKMFNLEHHKIIVAKPKVPLIIDKSYLNDKVKKTTFFFPTFPRPFKNIRVICEAVRILNANSFYNFTVKITINGTENKYSSSIINKYGNIPCIEFIGLISRENVYNQYYKSDCLIFPSKLETWGLPISEFKQFNKPMIVSDLPYARETVGNYDKVLFFNPTDELELAKKMLEVIKNNKIKYSATTTIVYPQPFAENWSELFSILFKRHENV